MRNKYIFSPRESDVLMKLTEGYVVKEVADELCISFYTADTHIKNAKKKSGASNMAQLIKFFVISNKELFLSMVFVMIQSISIINDIDTERRVRTGRKTARISRVLRTNKAII